MASDDVVSGNAIFYAELLTAKVVEGISGVPVASEAERKAMLELVAAKLTALAAESAVSHASG